MATSLFMIAGFSRSPAFPGAWRDTEARARMGVLKRRSMLVTFRLSAEEHEQLQNSCVRCGARSISDFVRVAALQRVVMLSSPAGGLSGDLMTLTQGLRELDEMLAAARKRIRVVLGPVPRDHDRSDIGARAAAGFDRESKRPGAVDEDLEVI